MSYPISPADEVIIEQLARIATALERANDLTELKFLREIASDSVVLGFASPSLVHNEPRSVTIRNLRDKLWPPIEASS
jgi:hypothetical protein